MPTVFEDKLLLSVQELADYLGVATSTLYSWRSRGEGPPGYRVGGQLRFRLAEVDAWVEQRGERP